MTSLCALAETKLLLLCTRAECEPEEVYAVDTRSPVRELLNAHLHNRHAGTCQCKLKGRFRKVSQVCTCKVTLVATTCPP